MSPLTLDPPSPEEVVEALRAIVNRWSGDYHCCSENKHTATHGAGCPLIAGLLILARIRPVNGESGRPVSEPPRESPSVPAASGGRSDVEEPDITISGRPEEAPTCRRCGKVGHVAQRDSIAPGEPAGRNCRIAIGQEPGPLHPPAGPEFVEGRFAMPLVPSGELSRRDGPPRVGRGADFPQDDGTYVVEVIPAPPRAPAASDCPSCDGRGVYYDFVDIRTTNEKRFFACKACDGTGRRKESRHV